MASYATAWAHRPRHAVRISSRHRRAVLYSADEDIDSKFPTNIVVSSDGTCSWVPLGLYISSCPIDITWFPFDEQNCRMKFGSWTYDGSKINLTTRSDRIDTLTYQQNGEWKLLGRLHVSVINRHGIVCSC